jgi:hypothetical protein
MTGNCKSRSPLGMTSKKGNRNSKSNGNRNSNRNSNRRSFDSDAQRRASPLRMTLLFLISVVSCRLAA